MMSHWDEDVCISIGSYSDHNTVDRHVVGCFVVVEDVHYIQCCSNLELFTS